MLYDKTFLFIPRFWVVLSLLALILQGTACRDETDVAEGEAPVQPVRIGPENSARVEKRTLQVGPVISGWLEPRERAVIRAEAAGALEQVRVDLGESVEKNQLLATIDTQSLGGAVRSARAAVASAEQALVVARRQAERTERLVDAGALAVQQAEVDRNAASSAEAQLEQARAELATAQEQLSNTRVRAPIAGAVSQRVVSQGDVVAAGAHLFTIIDPSTMRLEALVPTTDLSALEVGARVKFEVRGYKGQTFSGSIEQIAPAAEPVSKQIQILVSIPNPERRLVAGLFAEGRIGARSKQVLSVPLSAVDMNALPPKVRVIRDGKVAVVSVKVGLVDEVSETVEILEGLKLGERVLTGVAQNIASGTPVRFQGGSTAAGGGEGK